MSPDAAATAGAKASRAPPAVASEAPDTGRNAWGRIVPTGVAQVYEIARKEVLQHVRTKRLIIIGLFFFLSLQLITMVIPLAFDLVDTARPSDVPSHENQWFFIHLNSSLLGGLFAIQLLCIVLTADSVCSEWSNRTIFLLLSKPVSRTAFVVGKYLGSLAAILPTILLIYLLQYAIMNAVYEGAPSGREVAGFFAALGLLCLGAATIAAFALFVSTLVRSNVMALVISLLSMFIVFPIIGAIGDISYIVDADDVDDIEDVPDVEDWKYDWSHYASPERVLAGAPPQLIVDEDGDDDDFTLSGFVPQFAPQRWWMTVISGCAFITAGLAGAIAVVNRRDFE